MLYEVITDVKSLLTVSLTRYGLEKGLILHHDRERLIWIVWEIYDVARFQGKRNNFV